MTEPRTAPAADIESIGFIAGIGLLLSMVAFPIDFCLPSLPAIGRALGVDARYAQLVISVTILGYSCAHIPIGLLADRFGRRRVLIGSLVVYLCGALGSTLAGSIETLLLARFLLGIGATAGPVLARAIVRDVASEAQGVRLMSAGIAITSSALIVMPLIGSLVLKFAGWRSVLLLTVVHGVAVLAYVVRRLPETAAADHRHHSAWRQFRRSCKLYFTSPQSLTATLILAVGFGGFFTFITSGSTVVVEVYGLPATTYALLYMIPMGATALSAMLLRRWVLRIARSRLAIGAVSLYTVVGALLGFFALAAAPPLVLLWPVIAVYCFAYGMMLPLLMMIVLEPLPEVAGFASSIMGTLQFGMATAMSSLSALLFSGTARNMVVLMAVMALLTGVAFFAGRHVIHID